MISHVEPTVGTRTVSNSFSREPFDALAFCMRMRRVQRTQLWLRRNKDNNFEDQTPFLTNIFVYEKCSENSSFYWEIQRKTSTNLSASTRIYRSYLTHPFLFLEYLQLHMQRMNDSNLCSPKLQLKNQEVVLFLHLIC
jgi:hypothetical protein